MARRKLEPDEKVLTDKQKVFVDIYVEVLDRAEAYSEAFGVKKDEKASKYAHKLLQMPHVAKYKDEQLNLAMEGRKADLKAIFVREVEKLSTAKLEDFLDDDGNPDIEKMRANPGIVSEFHKETTFGGGENASTTVKKRIKLHSKTEALKMLGNYTGANKETPVQVDVTINQSILTAPTQIPLDEWNKLYGSPST